MQQRTASMTTAATVRRILLRTAWFVLAWIVVSEADLGSLVMGVPFAVIAAVLSNALIRSDMPRVSVRGTFRYIGFFVVQSVLGGIDVAARALRPSLPLDPGCIWYPIRITGRPARVLFADTISLLPGTLSARMDGDRLEVHMLDMCARSIEGLVALEDRVGAVFGQTLAPRTIEDLA
jgi:multicomponent Na+:H+ antiporter subunit E